MPDPLLEPRPTPNPAIPNLVPPTLVDFISVIARIGLTSFGGGVSGWMLRVVVHEKRWMTEIDFLTGLALCQVFPGINVVNLSIWLGYRMFGNIGAVIGPLAMIVPTGIVIIGIASIFSSISGQPLVRIALEGVTAAAIGLGASMGIRAARRCKGLVAPLIMAATFCGVGVFHLNMALVLLPLVPLSIAYAWRQT